MAKFGLYFTLFVVSLDLVYCNMEMVVLSRAELERTKRESPVEYGSGWVTEACGYDGDFGPHSMDCLSTLWLGSGCKMWGEQSPTNADQTQIDWWNDRTVYAVRNDMDAYFDHAMNGDEGYKRKCFGDESSCSYQKFEGYALYGFNDVILSSTTPEACATECDKKEDDCKSFDFNTQKNACFLSSASRETAPNSYGAHEYMDYYEKTCNAGFEDPWEDDEDADGMLVGAIEYTDGQCYVKYGPIGGSAGNWFDDRPVAGNEKITKIAIRHASLVDAIQLTYGDRTGDRHGGSGGRLFQMVLDSDEYIKDVAGSTGSYWDSITITTNKRTVGPFGSPSGGTPFKIVSGDKSLAYINGKSGGLIDHLSFYFNC